MFFPEVSSAEAFHLEEDNKYSCHTHISKFVIAHVTNKFFTRSTMYPTELFLGGGGGVRITPELSYLLFPYREWCDSVLFVAT